MKKLTIYLSMCAFIMLLCACNVQVTEEKPSESLIPSGEIDVSTEKNETQTEPPVEENLDLLGLVTAKVKRVVDGDTILVDISSNENNSSNEVKVRLVGVNTPESTTRTEVYGKEASNYTKSRLDGKTVYLQKDISDTDRYGRLLRLVWTELPNNLMDIEEVRTKMFNAELVLEGYAMPSTYNPDVTYSDMFRDFGREARENNMGLWSYDKNGTTKGDELYAK